MRGRILFGIAILLLGFLLPWWVAFVLFFIGSFLYAPWFELLVIGIFYDLVFGIARESFSNFQFTYTAVAVLAITLMYIIKKKIINV
ncbi:MAG: hypothetical protein RL641_542 [Candidatus Parcubacteria bacterium]|jgi:hypothetical protein